MSCALLGQLEPPGLAKRGKEAAKETCPRLWTGQGDAAFAKSLGLGDDGLSRGQQVASDEGLEFAAKAPGLREVATHVPPHVYLEVILLSALPIRLGVESLEVNL